MAAPFPPSPFEPKTQSGHKAQQSRKALLLALGAAGAVVLIVALIWGVSALFLLPDKPSTPFTGGKTPQEAVELYLGALARADAEKALALGVGQPASREFLTAEVLKKQLAEWPITGLRVLSSTPSGTPDIDNVHVAVRFGSKTSDETLAVRNTPAGWKLPHATIALQPSATSDARRSMEFLTLFGKPAGNMASIDVFPGWLGLSSLNKNIVFSSDRDELLPQLGQGKDSNWLITVDLAPQGHGAVLDALRSKLESCEQSNELAPRDCPNKLKNPQAAEGTVQWTETEDYQDEEPEMAVDLTKMTASVTVTLHWDFTVKLVGGGSGSGSWPTQPWDFRGVADLTQDPLEVVF